MYNHGISVTHSRSFAHFTFERGIPMFALASWFVLVTSNCFSTDPAPAEAPAVTHIRFVKANDEPMDGEHLLSDADLEPSIKPVVFEIDGYCSKHYNNYGSRTYMFDPGTGTLTVVLHKVPALPAGQEIMSVRIENMTDDSIFLKTRKHMFVPSKDFTRDVESLTQLLALHGPGKEARDIRQELAGRGLTYKYDVQAKLVERVASTQK